MPRCSREQKERILHEMALTAACIGRLREATDPWVRRRLFDKIGERMARDARLVAEAGYPRLASRILAALEGGGSGPRPKAYAMPVPRPGAPPALAIGLLIPGSSRHSIVLETRPRWKSPDAQ